VLRMRSFLDHGWYLLDGDLLGGEPGPWEDQQYVYGPVMMLLLQGWVAIWGLDGGAAGAGVPATAEAYAVRHLGVALVALVGVAAAAGLARLVLRSWSWALVCAAVLVTIPVWTGHAMFNVKDVPVATGFTLVTLGLALLVHRGGRWQVGGAAACLLAGTVLAVGTRPGIWAGLALSVAAASAVLALRRSWRRMAAGGGALLAAYGLLLAIYPAVFSTPVAALIGSAAESSRYGGTVGHWWYLPLFVLVEMPSGYLALGLFATVVTVSRLRPWRPSLLIHRRRSVDASGVPVVVLVLLQCYALPVLAIARQSNIYTGVRQMLFAAPAVAVLVTVGIALLLGRRERWSSPLGRVAARLVPAGIVVAMVSPLVAQLQLFPYSYAYSSVPANLAAPFVADRTGFEVPTDYWRTSVRELAPAIPEGGWVTCSPHTDATGAMVRYSRESHEHCATDPIGPLAPYDDLRTGSWVDGPTRMLAVETGTARVADNCERVAEVRRWLYWRPVTMGYVAACDLHLVAYPAGGLDLDPETAPSAGGEHLLGGWHLHAAQRGAAVREQVAWVGFALPGAGAGPLELTGTVTGGAGLRLEVNGAPVAVSVTWGIEPEAPDRFRALVPAEVAGAYGEDRVLVGFADTDRRDGAAALLTLQAERGGTS
jgi:hypothetical protein